MFDVYQRQERRQYPDAKSMVINWGQAADSFLNSMHTGADIASKLQMMSIRNEELDMAKKAMVINQADAAQRKQLNDLNIQQKTLDLNMLSDRIKSGADAAGWKLQLATTQQATDNINRTADAVLTVNSNMDVLDSSGKELRNAIVAASEKDPLTQMAMLKINLEDFKGGLEQSGIDPDKTMAGIQNVPGMKSYYDLLHMATPEGQKALLDTVTIPVLMPTGEQQTTLDNQALAAEGGLVSRPDSNTTKMAYVNLPLSQAAKFFRTPEGKKQFGEFLQSNQGNALLPKFLADTGLDKIAAPTPNVTTPAATAPTPAEAISMQNPIVKSKANDQFFKIMAESPLAKVSGSDTLMQSANKMLNGNTSMTLGLMSFGLLGPLAPAMATPGIVRHGADAVKWIADETGIGVEKATAAKKWIDSAFPTANDAIQNFTANPENNAAQQKYLVDQRDAAVAKLKGAEPKDKVVLQSVISQLNAKIGTNGVIPAVSSPAPAATADQAARQVADNMTSGYSSATNNVPSQITMTRILPGDKLATIVVTPNEVDAARLKGYK